MISLLLLLVEPLLHLPAFSCCGGGWKLKKARQRSGNYPLNPGAEAWRLHAQHDPVLVEPLEMSLFKTAGEWPLHMAQDNRGMRAMISSWLY